MLKDTVTEVITTSIDNLELEGRETHIPFAFSKVLKPVFHR